ncbi:MAG: hypothetical protein ACRDKA_15565 [Actinomycetota bacterium]
MGDAPLERELGDLGHHVAWPAPADLAASIGAELEAATVVSLRPRSRRRVALVAAAALVVGGLLAVSPGLRAALLDLFRLPGARIEVRPTPSPLPPPTVPQRLEELVPGEPVSLADARRAAQFDVAFPRELGPPDQVVLAGFGEDAVVTLAWQPRPGLPAADETGFAAILTEFRARPREDLIKKVTVVTRVESVIVGGEQGYWIDGPHSVLLLRRGSILEDRPRLSASSLVWTRDGLLLRLETDLTLAESVRLARSAR